MNLTLNPSKSYKNIMITVAVISLSALVAATFITGIFAYVSAACLAAFLLTDRSKKKCLSLILISAFVLTTVLYNALALFVFDKLGYSIYGVEIPVLAFLIAFMFSKKRTKAETVIVLCAAVTVFTIVDFYLLLAHTSGTFSFTENKELLLALIAELKEMFIKTLTDITFEVEGLAQSYFTEEAVGAYFDAFLQLWLGLLFIPVFFGAGILCKVFSYVIFIIISQEDAPDVIKWHFTTTNIIAYFYCVICVINVFTTESTIFAIAVANLNIIFTVLYAYIGFGFALAMLSVRRKRSLAWLIIIIAMLIAPSLSLQLLSFLGVFCTVIGNKAGKNEAYSTFEKEKKSDDNSEDKK